MKLREYSKSKLSAQEMAKITGGYNIPCDFNCICNVLYACIGLSHEAGDKDSASACFQAWVSTGC